MDCFLQGLVVKQVLDQFDEQAMDRAQVLLVTVFAELTLRRLEQRNFSVP